MMVSAAHSASTHVSPDFRLGRPEAVAARRHSLSTYIALAAAGLVIALSIAQAAVTSGTGAESVGQHQGATSVYVAAPFK